MRVSVDADRCQGHALVTSSDVPADLEDKVRDAVRNCPERAITVA